MKKVIIIFILNTLFLFGQNRLLIKGIKEGDKEKVIKAIKNGEDYNKKYRNRDIIFYAINKRNLDIVEYLLKYKNINIKDEKGFTLLHYAACYDDPNIIKFLLDKGANLESKSLTGGTPLMTSVYFGRIKIIKYLLDKGANIKAFDNAYTDTYFLALQSPNLNKEVLDLLIKYGAKVDRPYLGTSVVQILLEKDRLDILEHLIKKHGLKIKTQKKGRLGLVAWLYTQKHLRKHIEPIIKLGATPLTYGDQYYSLPYYAMKRDDVELIKFMITKGYDINWKDKYGKNLLFHIINQSSDRFFTELIKLGANPNISIPNHGSLIEYAMKKGHVEKVKILIKYGAKHDKGKVEKFLKGKK